jgi:hypothetical protein
VQNINIIYKVDKSDVERSNQTIQKARDLTDQLKQSSKSYTDQATKGNKQFQGSIEAVKVRMAQLRAQIDLTNRSDVKRIEELKAQYRQAKTEVDKFYQSVNKGSQQANQSTNSLAGGFQNLVGAIKILLAAQVAKQLVEMALSSATLAGQVETVGRAFQKQIPAAEMLLDDLRKATRGTVGDLELMQRALKFQNFGGDVQKLPQLLEFAAVRAQQTGESVDYMVNSIIDGIGRKSLRVLDNLGLSQTRIKEAMHGVSIEAASVAEVSRAMGEVAAEELQKMGGYAETSATHVEQLSVSVKGLKEEWAEFVTAIGGNQVAVILKGYVDSFKDLLEAQNRGISVSDLYVERERKEIAQISAKEWQTRRLIGTTKENIAALEEEIAAVTKGLGEFAKDREATEKTIDWLNQERLARKGNVYVMQNNIDLIKEGLDIKMEDARIDQEILKILQTKLQLLKKEDEAQAKQLTTIKTLRDEIEELNRIREEETSAYDQAELDRLQRLINKKEDLVLKIADNIEWQKKWNTSTIQTKFAQDQLTEAIEEQEKAIEELNKMFGGKGDPKFKEDFGELEIEAEVVPKIDWANEKWTRMRLDLRKAFKESADDLAVGGIDMAASFLDAEINNEVAAYQTRLNHLHDFYAEQQLLAGDNERYKKELQLKEQRETIKIQREMAIKQKKARIFSIVIDTAASIAKAWVNPGWPGAVPLSAYLLAQGAAQAAIVSRAPVGFAKGVIDLKGPGTGTSDSIPANLSRGESVMTAQETRTSNKTLKLIRAKKLDDKVLARIAAKAKGGDGMMFDDSKIVAASRRIEDAINNTDIIEKAGIIYKVREQGKSTIKEIKNKVSYGL